LKTVVADLTLDKAILRDALEKMVSPCQRRAVVAWAETAYQISERRACRTLAIHRAVIRYESVKPDDAPGRRHVMLRRDGLTINHKKTHRLYIEEGLQLKPRRRRRRSATVRQPREVVTGPNERWAMDFMHDVLATG
jgi:putative transposase